jgi:DNA-directed RNA polymerase subunit RPC12/RpoP
MADPVVRCPYCVRRGEFLAMDLTGDGRYVCSRCGHIVILGSRTLRCPCDHCKAMEAFVRDGQVAWPASA